MDESIGYWNLRKIKLKEKFSNITDEDLNFHEDKEKEMIELLSYKLGKTKEQFMEIILAL